MSMNITFYNCSKFNRVVGLLNHSSLLNKSKYFILLDFDSFYSYDWIYQNTRHILRNINKYNLIQLLMNRICNSFNLFYFSQ